MQKHIKPTVLEVFLFAPAGKSLEASLPTWENAHLEKASTESTVWEIIAQQIADGQLPNNRQPTVQGQSSIPTTGKQ